MSSQSKLESAVESTINIGTGFVVSYLVWIFVIPVFWPELKVSHAENFAIVAIFTASSWLRSYFWRRFFANDVHRKIHAWVK